MFTMSGFSEDRREVAMFPAVLNTLSDAVLVAQMHIYFLASRANKGQRQWLSHHHDGVSRCVRFLLFCLQTLRLELLKLVFQPLHKFLVSKL
jgi:hypothetical protein